MITERQINQAGEVSGALFGNGFHCAEAVAWATLTALDQEPTLAAAHATAFGGGFGRSFEEACGALSGGLIVIGHIHGRCRPGGSWDVPATLSADLRKRFIQAFGTTHCATLRERFEPELQESECRKLVQHVVISLLALLHDDADRPPAPRCACEAD